MPHIAVLVAALACLHPLSAQTTEGQGARFDGFHVNSITAFTGYTTLGLPNADFNYLMGVVPTGGDVQAGGGISVGFTRFRPRSSVSLTYDPSYSGMIRHSEWNALNHSLSFRVAKKFGKRWDWSLSMAGSASSMYQFLFTPTALSNAAAVPSSMEELAGAMVSGRYTNDQLAAVLTGAPGLESPERTVLYGNRVLSASASTGVTYSPTGRLSFHFGANASRSQFLDDGNQPASTNTQALLARTTSGGATAGFSYAITPKTDFGVDASSTRTQSAFQDAYTTAGVVSLGRRIGRRWLVQGRGGPSWITAVRQTYQLPRGIQYSAGGTMGYKTSTQTILGTVDRSAADSYGAGAGYTLSAGGTWRRHRPGSLWTLSSSLRQQRMRGTEYADLEGWVVSGSVSRALNRRTAMQITYTYMTNSGTYLGSAQEINSHSIQIAFLWKDSFSQER